MIAYSSKEKKYLGGRQLYRADCLYRHLFLRRRDYLIQHSGKQKADLEVSRSTYMTGMWEGNIFIADTVTIYHFN